MPEAVDDILRDEISAIRQAVTELRQMRLLLIQVQVLSPSPPSPPSKNDAEEGIK